MSTPNFKPNFSVELTGALDAMRQLSDIPAHILQAQKWALLDVQRDLKTEAKRDIHGEYNLRAGRIAKGLSTRNTSEGVALIGSSRGVNAIQFGATWKRVSKGGVLATTSRSPVTRVKFGGRLRGQSSAGAVYALKRGAPRLANPGTFIARGLSGDSSNGPLLVLRRKDKGRLPLEGIYGPSVGQMLKHGRRPERLVDFAMRTMQKAQARLLRATP